MTSTAVARAQHSNDREDWLRRIAKEIEPWYEQTGYPLKPYRIGVGFPSAGRKGKAIGECWASEASRDKVHEIFIHPGKDDPVEVAAVLVHELVHVAVGVAAKHGSLFKRVAKAVGLEGPMRSTHAGDVLIDDLKKIMEKVGPYPHGALDSSYVTSSRGPKQRGRMIKAQCPECGYIIRASRGCLEIGVPPCPNPDCKLGYMNTDDIIEMIAEAPDDEVENPDKDPE